MAGMSESPAADATDDLLWLEDIHGEAAMQWVTRENARSEALLLTPQLEHLESAALEVMDSDEKIPMVAKHGEHYYNFWRDAAHPRGLFRRTTWESWISRTPVWDVIIDLDVLAEAESVPWVWGGARLLRPQFTDGRWRRLLIALSPDGGDARRHREFDLVARRFVPSEEGGFDLPAAKTSASWLDGDTLLVGTDTGEGSLTTSSYPARTRRLERGQALAEAPVVFEVPLDHVQAWAGRDHTPGFERTLAVDVIDFFRSVTYLLDERGDGDPVAIDVPETVEVDMHREWLLLRPQEPWEHDGVLHAPGSLLVAPLQDFLEGDRSLSAVFVPDERTSLQGWSWTATRLVLQLLTDVSSEIRTLEPGTWHAESLEGAGQHRSTAVWAVDDEDPACGDDIWVSTSGFLTPTTILRGTLEQRLPETVKQAPSFFDASGLTVEQHWAVSADGTRIPYYQVGPSDLPLDGRNPTLLSGYGGFEVSRTPGYSGVVGRSWLTRTVTETGATEAGAPEAAAPGRSGVYVIANIRGGGEYGPSWHRAALGAKRHRAYEDFAAVARDLHERGVSSPSTLACAGGSNGGLLVGNMLTTHPELFAGISCGVPLLDMRRYTRLSAGTSWVAEYGDPDDPEQWEFIRTFSPYHLVEQDRVYPPVLFWTATSDDRVGPVQARKMAERMRRQGHERVWFHETLEGGHAGAGDNRQAARSHALSYDFMWRAVTGTL